MVYKTFQTLRIPKYLQRYQNKQNVLWQTRYIGFIIHSLMVVAIRVRLIHDTASPLKFIESHQMALFAWRFYSYVISSAYNV